MNKSKELYVEFMSIYSHIEAVLNYVIEAFLTPTSEDKSFHLRSLVLNRALHKPNIFLTVESKIKFISLIEEYIHSSSVTYSLDYDLSAWKEVKKKLKEIQEVRNKLAHEWLNFEAEEGLISFYKGTTRKTELLKYDMEKEVQKSKELRALLERYHITALNSFRRLFNVINEHGII